MQKLVFVLMIELRIRVEFVEFLYKGLILVFCVQVHTVGVCGVSEMLSILI